MGKNKNKEVNKQYVHQPTKGTEPAEQQGKKQKSDNIWVLK